jgi:hypothetical protein
LTTTASSWRPRWNSGVGELEDVVDQLFLDLLEDSLGGSLADQVADLFFGDERGLLGAPLAK